MRISIIGQPASGKTFLADAISKKYSIPHIHIDRFWLEAGGRQGSHDTPNIEQVRAHVRSEIEKAIQGESWVSDGFYSRFQSLIVERADVVVFLDVPLSRRLWNHAVRMCRTTRRHAELSFWDEIMFFLEIIRRSITKKEKFAQFLNANATKVVVVRSRKEALDFLENPTHFQINTDNKI